LCWRLCCGSRANIAYWRWRLIGQCSRLFRTLGLGGTALARNAFARALCGRAAALSGRTQAWPPSWVGARRGHFIKCQKSGLRVSQDLRPNATVGWSQQSVPDVRHFFEARTFAPDAETRSRRAESQCFTLLHKVPPPALRASPLSRAGIVSRYYDRSCGRCAECLAGKPHKVECTMCVTNS
jgi:hypothetical protein